LFVPQFVPKNHENKVKHRKYDLSRDGKMAQNTNTPKQQENYISEFKRLDIVVFLGYNVVSVGVFVVVCFCKPRFTFLLEGFI
jgi:hypothetical protein